MANEPQKENGALASDVHHAHVGPVLGMLVLVLILILGGLYLWGSLLSKNTAVAPVERTLPNNEPETPRANADREILNTVSASSDLDAIYADLESTNLDALESDLDQIDAELKGSI